MVQLKLTEPIIVKSSDLERVPARVPGITKVVYFENGAGDYHIGRSSVSHPLGVECGEHTHRGAQEAFFVQRGTGCVTIDGVDHHLSVGDTIVVPRGALHNVRGTSKHEEFEILCDFIRAPGYEDDPAPWAPVTVD